MFVVNRVELALLHELKQMRKLHRYQATRLQKQLETFDKIVQVWHMCQHIVPDNQIRRPAVFNEVARSFFAEKEHFGLDALFLWLPLPHLPQAPHRGREFLVPQNFAGDTRRCWQSQQP